jgi:NAD(P)-dependent dehydrogenase (short-subunit alcohol dehydrogenase family)
VVAITEATAQVLGPYDNRVNSLLPGATETEMLKRIFSLKGRDAGITETEVMERVIRATALKRVSVPEDMAAGAPYLASGNARTVTGPMIVINADMRLGGECRVNVICSAS